MAQAVSSTVPVGSYQLTEAPKRIFHHVGGPDLDLMPILEEIFNRILTPLYGPQEKALRQIREATDRTAFLLYEGEYPVGVLVFKTVLSNEFATFGIQDSIEVKSLFVDNSGTNSGRGLGSALVNKLKEEVEKLALGEKGIHVTVSEEKQDSLAFFKKKGFQIAHEWKGRYTDGVVEYLLHCPTKVSTATSPEEVDLLTQRFAKLLSGTPRSPATRNAPQLVHVIENAHYGDIHGFIHLSDGTFVSCAKDHSIYKWSREGEKLRVIDELEPSYSGTRARRWITAISKVNEAYFATGDRDGSVSLWDTNGDHVRDIRIRLPWNTSHVCHQYNKQRVCAIASGVDALRPSILVGYPTLFSEFNFMSSKTESVTVAHKNDWVFCIEPLTPSKILTVTGCTIREWEKENHKWNERRLVLGERKKHKGQRPFISSMKPLNAEKTQFGLAVFGGRVEILDTETGSIVKTYREHQKRVWGIEKVSDHVFASCAEDRTIRFWDDRQRKNIGVINDYSGEVTSMISIDESTLVVGNNQAVESSTSDRDTSPAEIRIYDIRR